MKWWRRTKRSSAEAFCQSGDLSALMLIVVRVGRLLSSFLSDRHSTASYNSTSMSVHVTRTSYRTTLLRRQRIQPSSFVPDCPGRKLLVPQQEIVHKTKDLLTTAKALTLSASRRRERVIASVSRDEFNIGSELEAVHIPSVETFVKKIRGLQDRHAVSRSVFYQLQDFPTQRCLEPLNFGFAAFDSS